MNHVDDVTAQNPIGLPASLEEEPITWLQVTVDTTPAEQAAIEACFEQHGCLSITLVDAEDDPIFEPLPGETPLWPSLRITSLFELPKEPIRQAKRAQHILDCLQAALGVELISSILENEEWVRTCLKDFHPIDVGHGLWVVPSWLEAPSDATIALKLDPGLAFGTGTHPTTFLCLAWLAQRADQINKATRVLDFGCGSGILAIGAALLGAENVQATDIDSQALLATNMNATKNQVSDFIQTLKPAQLSRREPNKPTTRQLHSCFDIVLANILAEPLIELAPILAELVAPGGSLCMSGLLARHVEVIKQAYAAQFTHFSLEILDGWARVSATKRI